MRVITYNTSIFIMVSILTLKVRSIFITAMEVIEIPKERPITNLREKDQDLRRDTQMIRLHKVHRRRRV